MAFEKALLGTKFIDLCHLSFDVARYERARAIRALAKIDIHKGPHYKEMTKILAHQTNETDFDSIDKKELE